MPLPEYWSPQPLLGFRFWHITQGGVRGAARVWPRPFLDAECRRAAHEAPHPHCTCGIYALREATGLWLSSPALCLPAGGSVYGLVALSGRVVEHERGFRAARAEVRAVVVRYRGWITAFADARLLDRLFARPERAIPAAAERGWPVTEDDWRGEPQLGAQPPVWAVGFLLEEARRFSQAWTSASPSE